MIERLIFNGVDHFFVAPGSRSSPLVSAIAHLDGAKIYSHIDERSLAFMALGYAQCTGMPGVMVVTSGTAVANLMPAVVEAKASLVPMIILSADRPYELRDTGANQTIDQAHLFSGHTIKSYDLAPPSTNVSIKKSQAIFDQALGYAVGVNPGPVQINIQLREPLHNISDAKTWYESSGLEHKFIQAKFYNPTASSLNSLFGAKNILFVVGEMRQALVQEKIIKLAEQLACPIFADITSNLRLKSHPLIMHHFDLALLNPQFMEELRPDVVIHFGDRVVSKRYWNFVEKSHAVRFIRLHENNITIDQTGVYEHVYVGDWEHFFNEIKIYGCTHNSFTQRLLGSHKVIAKKVVSFLAHRQNNEAFFANQLIACMSEKSNLFISSSMPIRDVDQCALPLEVDITIFANRGASGIDGVISSAVGVSIASSNPSTLLIGDVAFLHDSNGLMALKNSPHPLMIVVINNSGGGIFHFLPIASEQEVITPLLDTPHTVNIEQLCEAHQIDYFLADEKNFQSIIRKFFEEKASRVVEVKINREQNVLLHRQFYQDIVDAELKKDCCLSARLR